MRKNTSVLVEFKFNLLKLCIHLLVFSHVLLIQHDLRDSYKDRTFWKTKSALDRRFPNLVLKYSLSSIFKFSLCSNKSEYAGQGIFQDPALEAVQQDEVENMELADLHLNTQYRPYYKDTKTIQYPAPFGFQRILFCFVTMSREVAQEEDHA